MKIIPTILFILIFVLSCHKNKEDNGFKFMNVKQEERIYSLINDFIIDSLEHPDLLSIEAMSFCDTSYNDDDPPLPPGYLYCYRQYTFNRLLEEKIIDSLDLISFKEQMKQLKQLNWNSDSIKLPIFSTHDLFQKLDKETEFDIYEYIRETYNSRNYITLSTPLFSVDNDVIVISVELFCGGTCGGGTIYAFKYINGSWHILYSSQEWVS